MAGLGMPMEGMPPEAMGMPPMDPMMGGAPPMGAPPMGGMMPPMGPSEQIMGLFDAAMSKWTSGEAQIAGEQNAVVDVLAGILMAPGAQDPATMMVEGGPMGDMGMSPMPDMGALPPGGPMPPAGPPMM